MNTPDRDTVSKEALELLKTTLYLDQVGLVPKFAAFLKMLFLKPRTMMTCLGIFFRASPMQSFRDYRRLGYHLVEACYLYLKFRNDPPAHIHSHFITGATSINMFLSELLGVPFSFTMHASAIWIDPIAFRDKLSRCHFCVSISEYNRRYVGSEYGVQFESKIHIVHCGIKFPVETRPRRSEQRDSTRVLSVGQLRKRKGYHVLIEAARILEERGVPIEWSIVGDGPLRSMLEEKISRYGLGDRVTLHGAQPHETIPGYLDSSDIFALPCVIGDDNTRDGIPVAMMEAMAWKIPVVSTNIVGLPELIETGKEGILVNAESPEELADAIDELASSPSLRSSIGEAAEEKVRREFNAMHSAEQLALLFRGNSLPDGTANEEAAA